MNDEILAGLKIAIEHGFSLEEAIKSFINAGYNSSEVQETANFLSKGFPPLPSIAKDKSTETNGKVVEIKEKIIQKEKLPEPPVPIPKRPKSKFWIIMALIVLVMLGIAISYLLFKDKFVKFWDLILSLYSSLSSASLPS